MPTKIHQVSAMTTVTEFNGSPLTEPRLYFDLNRQLTEPEIMMLDKELRKFNTSIVGASACFRLPSDTGTTVRMYISLRETVDVDSQAFRAYIPVIEEAVRRFLEEFNGGTSD